MVEKTTLLKNVIEIRQKIERTFSVLPSPICFIENLWAGANSVDSKPHNPRRIIVALLLRVLRHDTILRSPRCRPTTTNIRNFVAHKRRLACAIDEDLRSALFCVRARVFKNRARALAHPLESARTQTQQRRAPRPPRRRPTTTDDRRRRGDIDTRHENARVLRLSTATRVYYRVTTKIPGQQLGQHDMKSTYITGDTNYGLGFI